MLVRHAVFVLFGSLCLALPMGSAGASAATADDAAASAREAARADRHDAAIAGFHAAIAAAPERRREWLLELADQYTWSGRLDAAIALYREGVAIENPDAQSRARIGLARALSWDGRHAAAVAEYRRALALGRDDGEATRGIARVQSWRGRHRDAVALMRAHLARHPDDREAAAILAESLEWMGRPDRAEHALRERLAVDADDRRAASMLERLEFARRPEARVDWRDFDQSDDVRISELALASRFHVADGRGYVGPRYSLATYRPPVGPVDEIRVQRPGVEARHRFSDSLDWHGSLFVDLIDTRGAAGDHAIATYETYFTYWPNDVLRFDVGSSRWTFDNEETLREGLVATQANASADVSPDDRTRLAARVSRADFSDGNARSWWQFQAERRLWSQPRITVGYRHTGFDFRTPGQGGYYSPDRYRSNEVLLQASGWLRDSVYWDVRLAAGRETELPGESRRIRGGGASVAVKVQPRLYVELAYDYSSSRTTSASGFERGIARLSLRQRF